MTDVTSTTFVYVTFIKTSPERLWAALTTPDFIKKYWFGTTQETDWQPGSSWKMVRAEGLVTDVGEILEIDPPRRLVLKWRNEFRPELKAEGYSRCTIEIEAVADAAKLTVVHQMDRPGTQFIGAVSGGWPRILSNLKSLIETGEVVLKS